MTNTNYAKTGFLLRVYLRRDWLKIMLWLIGVVGLMAGAAGKFDTLYGSSKAMNSIITTLRTPAMVSLLGPFGFFRAENTIGHLQRYHQQTILRWRQKR